MRKLLSILALIAPFLVGVVSGILMILSLNSWGASVRELAKLLAIAVVLLLLLAFVLWLVYRLALARLQRAAVGTFASVWVDLRESPLKLTDPEYRARYIWPMLPQIVRMAVIWLSLVNAMAFAITVAANVTLLASLSIQYLQADRLGAQNELLRVQVAADRVAAGRQLREDLAALNASGHALEMLRATYAESSAAIAVGEFDPCAAAFGSDECLDMPVIPAIMNGPGADGEYYVELVRTIEFLHRRARTMGELNDSMRLGIRESVLTANTACRFDGADAALLMMTLNRLDALDSAADDLLPFLDETTPPESIPADKLRKLKTALLPLVHAARIPDANQLTLGAFIEGIRQDSFEAIGSLQALSEACAIERRRLEELLISLEQETGRSSNEKEPRQAAQNNEPAG